MPNQASIISNTVVGCCSKRPRARQSKLFFQKDLRVEILLQSWYTRTEISVPVPSLSSDNTSKNTDAERGPLEKNEHHYFPFIIQDVDSISVTPEAVTKFNVKVPFTPSEMRKICITSVCCNRFSSVLYPFFLS